METAGQSFRLQDFRAGEELGKGAYGLVKLVLHVPTSISYALKVVSKAQFLHESSIQAIKREIRLHKSLDHPHVIKLHDYLEDTDHLYLVLEYAARGSLFRYMQKSGCLSEPRARHYFLQTCLGVQYLHSHNVIHRDLKPENLLISATNDIKICDFGWCTLGSETSAAFGGTLDYMAPEIVACTTHSFEVDIWALGVLLFELVHGRAPFNAVKKSEKCKQILSLSYTCDSKLSPSLQNLIQSLLRAVPQHRLSIADILTHPWLQEGPTDSSLPVEELKKNMPDTPLQCAENCELSGTPSSTIIHEGEALNSKLEDSLPTPSLVVLPLPTSPASTPLPRSRSLQATSPQSMSVIHSPSVQSKRQARLDALLLEAKQFPAESVYKPGLIGWVGSFFSCTNR